MAILKPQQAYSKIAKDYDKIYSSYKCEIENEYIRTILKNKKLDEGFVLDLGCGTGNFLDWFPDSIFRFKGIDISKAMIDVARYKYPEASFNVGDMADKNIYDKEMDSIISLFGSFSYCLQPERVIKYSWENLKNNGNFVIMPLTPKWAYFQSNVSFSEGVVSTQLMYTENIIRKLLNGFTIKNIYGFPILLDMLSKKYHNNKLICNALCPIDKLLSKRFVNIGAYLIVVAQKIERIIL